MNSTAHIRTTHSCILKLMCMATTFTMLTTQGSPALTGLLVAERKRTCPFGQRLESEGKCFVTSSERLVYWTIYMYTTYKHMSTSYMHLLMWQWVVHDVIHGAFPNPYNLHESNKKRQLTRRQRYCSLHCSTSPIANYQLASCLRQLTLL